MTRPLHLPFGPLDLSQPDSVVEPGTLRKVENLCWVGREDSPALSPVEGSALLHSLPGEALHGISGIVALGRQKRNRRGPLSSQSDSSLERLILVTSSKVYVLDEPNDRLTEVYSFSATDAARKVQFAQVGEYTILAITSGTQPDETLWLQDETCASLATPDLPSLTVTAAEVTGSNGFDSGVWAYRWAYLFFDGTVGLPSRPQLIGFQAPTGGKKWQVTFTIPASAYPNPFASSNPYSHIIRGIAIYLSEQVVVPAGATDPYSYYYEQPYYKVGVIEGTDSGDAFTHESGTTKITSGQTLDDTNLIRHGLESCTAFAYNGRLMLGDVSYDYAKPHALKQIVQATATDSGSDYQVRVGVTITTTKGDVDRIGSVAYVAAVSAGAVSVWGKQAWNTGGGIGSHSDQHFSYPDVRAKLFTLYVKQPAGVWKVWQTYAAIPATVGNLAFAKVGATVDITTSAAGKDDAPDFDALNAVRDRDANRVVVSDVFKPFSMPASGAFYTATDESDRIMGFAANTLPVGESQYGEAPVLVLGRYSVQALAVGTSTAFSRAFPVADRGCIGYYAFENVQGAVFFVSDDGVWTLTPSLSARPVSSPLHRSDSTPDVLSEIDSSTIVGYVRSAARDRREVWVATSTQTYAFSLRFGRWSTLTRTRKHLLFVPSGSVNYGADSSGRLLTEDTDTSSAQPVAIETALLNMGDPYVRKRVRRMGLRQSVQLDEVTLLLKEKMYPSASNPTPADTELATGTITAGYSTPMVNTPRGHFYEAYLAITGTGTAAQQMEALELQYEFKYPHRTRDRV